MRNRRGSPLSQLVYPCADPARRGPLAAPSIPPTLPIHTLIPPFSSLRVVCGPLPRDTWTPLPGTWTLAPRRVLVDPSFSLKCGPCRALIYVDPPTPECGPSRL
jgi:hypothetical protein